MCVRPRPVVVLGSRGLAPLETPLVLGRHNSQGALTWSDVCIALMPGPFPAPTRSPVQKFVYNCNRCVVRVNCNRQPRGGGGCGGGGHRMGAGGRAAQNAFATMCMVWSAAAPAAELSSVELGLSSL